MIKFTNIVIANLIKFTKIYQKEILKKKTNTYKNNNKSI